MQGRIVATVPVGKDHDHLREINEHTLPTIPMMAEPNTTEDAWYHRANIDALLGLAKNGDQVAIWAYEVIYEQQQLLDHAAEKLSKLGELIAG